MRSVWAFKEAAGLVYARPLVTQMGLEWVGELLENSIIKFSMGKSTINCTICD